MPKMNCRYNPSVKTFGFDTSLYTREALVPIVVPHSPQLWNGQIATGADAPSQ